MRIPVLILRDHFYVTVIYHLLREKRIPTECKQVPAAVSRLFNRHVSKDTRPIIINTVVSPELDLNCRFSI